MKQKIALISGASSGIGAGISSQLLDSGMKVFGISSRLENLSEFIELGGVGIECDLRLVSNVKKSVEDVLISEESIDFFINCAGISVFEVIENTKQSVAQEIFDINVLSLIELLKVVLPFMRNNNYGKIINIGSIGGEISMPMGGVYCASKSAQNSIFDSLRVEVKDLGIEIFQINPGPVKTNIIDRTRLKSSKISSIPDYSHWYESNNNLLNYIKNNKEIEVSVIEKLVQNILENKLHTNKFIIPFESKVFCNIFNILPRNLSDYLKKFIFYLFTKK